MCGTGNLQACDVMYAYDEMARTGVEVAARRLNLGNVGKQPKSDAGATQLPRNNPRLDEGLAGRL